MTTKHKKDSFYKEKTDAYNWLISKEIITPEYLKEMEKETKKIFKNGDVFKFAVPTYPKDARKAIRGLTIRIDASIDNYKKETREDIDFETAYEIYSLDPLSAFLLTVKIPEMLEWQVEQKEKGHPAMLLGNIWHKEMKWVPYYIKKLDGKNITPENISSFILLSPLNKFKNKKSLPISEALYKWIQYKAEWQVKKDKRKTSLDALAEMEAENPEDKTYSKLTTDTEAYEKIIDQAEQKLMIKNHSFPYSNSGKWILCVRYLE